MSEIKQNEAVEQEQNGGIDELVGAVFGKEAVGLGDETGKTHLRDRDETGGFEGFLERMHREMEAHRDEVDKRLRREAKASLAVGGLCGLGVGSLIGAAVSGVWVPVAVGLGVCLSGAAGILVYRGMVVMLG